MDNVIFMYHEDRKHDLDVPSAEIYRFTARLLKGNKALIVGCVREEDARVVYEKWQRAEARKLVGKRGPFNAA